MPRAKSMKAKRRRPAFSDLSTFPVRQKVGRRAPSDDYGPLQLIMSNRGGGIISKMTLGTHSGAVYGCEGMPIEVPVNTPEGWPLRGFTVIQSAVDRHQAIMASPAYQASTTCTYFCLWAATLLNNPSMANLDWEEGTMVSDKRNNDTYQNQYQEWEKAIGTIDSGRNDTMNFADAVRKIRSSDSTFTMLKKEVLETIQTVPRKAFATIEEYVNSITCLLDRGYAVAISPRNHGIVLVGYNDYSFLALSSFGTASVPAMFRNDQDMFATYRNNAQSFQNCDGVPLVNEYIYYRNFMKIPKRFVCSAYMDADMVVPVDFAASCYHS